MNNRREEKIEATIEKVPYHEQIIRGIQIFSKNWSRADVMGNAAQLAYFFLLALVPMLLMIANVIPLFPINADDVLKLLSNSLPNNILEIIRPILESYLDGASGGVVSMALLTAIWSASKIFSTLRDVLNQVYGAVEEDNVIITRLFSFVLMIGILFLMMGAMLVFVFGEQILSLITDYLHISIPFIQDFLFWRWIIIGVFLIGFFMIIYQFVPNHHLKIVYTLPGTFFSLIGWLLLSQFFTLYTYYAGGEMLANATLGSFIVLMIFIYFLNVVLLLGALLNTMTFEWQMHESVESFERQLQLTKAERKSGWRGYPAADEHVILSHHLIKLAPEGPAVESLERYAENGLVVERQADIYTVRLSDQLKDDLGEVAYAEVEPLAEKVTGGELLLGVEGEKAVLELTLPLSGTVVDSQANELSDHPEWLNGTDKDWIVRLTDVPEAEWTALATSAED